MFITLLIAAVYSSSFKAIGNAGWSVTSDQILTTSTTITNIIISPDETWPIKEGEEGTINVYFNDVAVTDPDDPTDFQDSAVATLDDDEDSPTFNKYVLASFEFQVVDLTAIDTLHVYVSYTDDQDVEQFVQTGVELPVITPWEIAPPTVKDTQLTKMPVLTITSGDKTDWTDTGMFLRFEWTKEVDTKASAKLAVTKDGNDYKTAANAPLTALGIHTSDVHPTDGLDLKVFLEIETDVDHPFVADFTVTLDAPEFTLVTNTLNEVDLATEVEVTIAAPADAPDSNGEGWDDLEITAVFTLEKTQPADITTGFVASGVQIAETNAVGDWVFTIDLSTMAVTDNTKEIYVYIYVAEPETSNTLPRFLAAPGTIAFTPEAAHSGVITLVPNEIAYEDLAAPGDIVVSIATGGANALAVLGPNSKYEIINGGKSVKGAILKNTTSQTSNTDVFYIADVDLSKIDIPDQAGTVEVRIHATGTRRYLTTTLGITSDTPVPPPITFTLDPAFILFEDIDEIGVLEVIPSDTVTWTDGVTLTFTYTAPGPSNGPVTMDVTFANSKWTTAATESLTALGLTADDLPATVVVTLFDGTADLADTFDFEIRAEPPVDPVTFTIAPANMEFAETLTTPIITVTPSDNHNWPTAAAANFKAIFKYGDKDDIPAAIAVSEADPPVYTIPATALAGFEITADDLPAEITVKINDNTAELAHSVKFTVKEKETPGGAAMGVSPLLSLLAALVFLFVKLF